MVVMFLTRSTKIPDQA